MTVILTSLRQILCRSDYHNNEVTGEGNNVLDLSPLYFPSISQMFMLIPPWRKTCPTRFGRFCSGISLRALCLWRLSPTAWKTSVGHVFFYTFPWDVCHAFVCIDWYCVFPLTLAKDLKFSIMHGRVNVTQTSPFASLYRKTLAAQMWSVQKVLSFCHTGNLTAQNCFFPFKQQICLVVFKDAKRKL